MNYTKEDKIKAIELGIKIEEARVEKLKNDMFTLNLDVNVFNNKRKIIDSTNTFIKKLKKDIEKLNKQQ